MGLIKLELNEVISRIISIYGDCFDLTKLVYVNSKTKILIGCKNHNETYWFRSLPGKLFNGIGCPICKRNWEGKWSLISTDCKYSSNYRFLLCLIEA